MCKIQTIGALLATGQEGKGEEITTETGDGDGNPCFSNSTPSPLSVGKSLAVRRTGFRALSCQWIPVAAIPKRKNAKPHEQGSQTVSVKWHFLTCQHARDWGAGPML